MSLTHWKKLTNPLYLGSYSIEDGKDLILTISDVREEQVVGADGKKEDCTVCYFSDADKPMILNSTNAKMISKVLGTPYIEEWRGHKIQIGIERVKAFGDVVDALRVRKTAPKELAPIACESCGKPIQPMSGMSAAQVAAYTAKKYGARLCADCAKRVAAEIKAQHEQPAPGDQAPAAPEQEACNGSDAK